MSADILQIDIISRSQLGGFAETKAAAADMNSSLGSSFSGVSSSARKTEGEVVGATTGMSTGSGKVAKTAERDLQKTADSYARAAGSIGDSSGKALGRVESLAAGIGGGGGLNLAIGGAVIGAGALYEIGKAAINNYNDQHVAVENLTQALAMHGLAYKKSADDIDEFVAKNRGLVSNQEDVRNSLAASLRAGLDLRTSYRLTQEAIDLSILKHEDLATATDTLIKAEEGQSRGLLTLGIKQSDLTAGTKSAAQAKKDLIKVEAELTKAQQADAAAQRTLKEGLDSLDQKYGITGADAARLFNLERAYTTTTGPAHVKAAKDLNAEYGYLHSAYGLSQIDLDHLQDKSNKAASASANHAAKTQAVAAATTAAATAGKKHADVLDLMAPRLEGVEKQLTSTELAQNKLNNDWRDLTAKIGPPLLVMLDNTVNQLDLMVSAVDDLASGKTKQAAANLAGLAIDSPVGQAILDLEGVGKHAAGGTRLPGEWSIVGEEGPELEGPASSARTVIPAAQTAQILAGGGGMDTSRIERLLEVIASAVTAQPGPSTGTEALVSKLMSQATRSAQRGLRAG